MNAPVARRLADLAIAVLLAGVGVAEIWVPLGSVMGEGSRVLSTVVVVVVCAALAFRRTYPLPAALVALLAWPLVYSLSPVLVLFWGQFVPIVVALYSVARHGTPRQAFVGGGRRCKQDQCQQSGPRHRFASAAKRALSLAPGLLKK